MKNTILKTTIMKTLYVLLILFNLVFIGCTSDNLSNSKAKKIISKCLKKEPEQRKALLQLGRVTFRKSKDKITKYKSLKKDGLIDMFLIKNKKLKEGNDPLAKWHNEEIAKREEYEIKLTEKGLKYIYEINKNGNSATVKIFSYDVDKILEVQEIPATNTAKVKIQYEATDITPFAILSSKDPSEYWVRNQTLKKTTDGWKYCDND